MDKEIEKRVNALRREIWAIIEEEYPGVVTLGGMRRFILTALGEPEVKAAFLKVFRQVASGSAGNK